MKSIIDNNEENIRLNKLRNVGICVDEAMDNICGDLNVLEDVLKLFIQDSTFNNLLEAVRKEDYQCAFKYAHTLKGVTANLGMKNLQIICNELVEKLRKNDYYGIDILIDNMIEIYNNMFNEIENRESL